MLQSVSAEIQRINSIFILINSKPYWINIWRNETGTILVCNPFGPNKNVTILALWSEVKEVASVDKERFL